jgi:transposase
VAVLDTTTGDLRELRIRHDAEDVERFYGSLPRPVTVAIESTGYALWFHALMQRLGHTLLVGDAAKNPSRRRAKDQDRSA